MLRPSLRPLFDLPTHLTDKEKIALYKLVKKKSLTSTNGITVLEIGSYLGASSSFLAAGFVNEKDKLICIDTWRNDAMSEGHRDTIADFLANTAQFRKQIITIQGWSYDPDVIANVASKIHAIDILFIDGDHSYEGAHNDWRLYSPILSADALVVMHDIGWAEGVQRVVAEDIRPNVVREQRLPNMWWGFFSK